MLIATTTIVMIVIIARLMERIARMIMIINLQYNGKDNEHNNYGKIDCGVFKVARERVISQQ